MKKILYVATVVKTHIMEFHLPYLKMLKDMGWETSVAARNDYLPSQDCIIPYCDKYYDIGFERNPFHPKNIKAYRELKKIIDNGDYDVIHCHSPVGGSITRIAAQKARKNGCKVFYTAHGFHFYKGAPLLNWIIYYPIEKMLAYKTDVLITITKEDYLRGLKFHARKVVYIPGVGIDLCKFTKSDCNKASILKEKLGIPFDATVLLSVGEINANKNHKIVFYCLPELKNTWYVLCGQGPLIEEYKKLCEDLGIIDRVIFAGYCTDIVPFYQMADIFVFPSLREGLPVALMEAIATEKVCVASRNRGTDDLMSGSRLLFSAKNIQELKEKLNAAMEEDCTDEIKRNKEHLQEYSIEKTLAKMRNYYIQAIK